MSRQVTDPCDIPGLKQSAACVVKDSAAGAADRVSTAIEFGKDPLGFIAQKEAEAAKDLAETVIPALSRLTQPDLSTDWFLSAYKISFAAAIMGWLLITLYDLATFKSRGESGREVVDSLTKWTPLFIGGSMFGPAAGAFLVKGIGALNASLVKWGLSTTADRAVAEFNKLVSDDPGTFLGGSFLAILILGALVLALLLVLLVLIVMLATLYFSGAVLPLSLMWLTKTGQREKGRKILMVWAGVLCSQPLIFLLLGFAFSGITEQMMDVYQDVGSNPTTADASLQTLVKLLLAIIMLAIATLGPTTLAAYAPVGPSDGAPAGPGINARGAGSRKSGGARGGAGPSSPSSSQTSQIAQQNAARQSSAGSTAATTQGASTAATAAGAATTGGLLLAAQGAKQGGQGLADKTSEMSEEAASQGGQAPGGTSANGSGTQTDRSTSTNGSAAGAAGQTAGGDGRSGPSRPGLGGDRSDVLSQEGGTWSGLGADSSSAGAADGSSGQAESGSTDRAGQQGLAARAQGGLGGVVSGVRDVAGQAGRLGGKAAGLAQRAGDAAESQMDHHRDGRRSYR